MTRHSALWFGGAALLALAAAPVTAQQAAPSAPGFVPQPTPTADKLAAAMSTLGRSPQDVEALIAAGEASAALDDVPAALQFLARAEKLRPADPRIPAARGRAFVRMGRPGEALRRFADAERGGLSAATFADDRGLAYDLVGDQAHAQVEYKRALAVRDDAEVRRRLAISQAISGDQPGAERTLDPLLRQQDRASWRTRALVMALGGNTTGAERVTATMMPGFSTAYLPLFRRLSEIRDPADRAFAAHLGEFTRTPARLADAGLAPAAPPLPQPAPVRVAEAAVPAPVARAVIPARAGTAQTQTARVDASADTKARARERRALERRAERDALMAERYGRRARRVETAAVDTRRIAPASPATGGALPVGRTPLPTTSTVMPVATAGVATTGPVPTVNAASSTTARIGTVGAGATTTPSVATPNAAAVPPTPVATAGIASAVTPPASPVSRTPSPSVSAATASTPLPSSLNPVTSTAASDGARAATSVQPPLSRPADPGPVAAGAPVQQVAPTSLAAAVPAPIVGPVAQPAPVTGTGLASATAPAPTAVSASPSLAGAAASTTAPAAIGSSGVAPGFSSTASVPQPAAPVAAAARPIGREDDVLAMIVRNIAVPAGELGVAAPQPVPVPEPSPAPTPAPEARRLPAPVRAAPVEPAPVASAKTAAAPKKPKSVVPTPTEAKPADVKKADAKKADAKAVDAKKADARNADDKKVDAKKTDAKKADAKKGDTKKPEPKKTADPARWWVQVAGGANVADLPKAWTALTARNPALKKRQAWTTPLRFTNRLLTGPFASSAEAQAFVNTLGKDGLSAFSFQSEAGQKVTRLPAK